MSIATSMSGQQQHLHLFDMDLSVQEYLLLDGFCWKYRVQPLRAHSIGWIWLLWIRIEQAEQLEQLVLNRTATVPAHSVCLTCRSTNTIALHCGRIHQITIQWIWIWIRPTERTNPDLEQPNITNRTRPYNVHFLIKKARALDLSNVDPDR